MAKNSAKKVVKKIVKKVAAVNKNTKMEKKPKHNQTPEKKVEKILEAGLDSQVNYAYENDSQSKSKKKLNMPKPKKVETGHLVAVEYVGKLKTGEEFDNSKGHGPIQFVVGNGQVIPGFDKAVLGMKIGDKKKFTIPKAEAYGDINPALVQVVPLNKIPENIRSQLKIGGFLVMQSPVGQQIPVKIVNLDKDNAHLDMNHPLAGQDLTFDIKIIDINHAPEQSGCDCGDCKDESCGPDCGCGHDHK
jgi:peptidylprolyl isomerase